MTALAQQHALVGELVEKWTKECSEGISDREPEALELIERYPNCGLTVKDVNDGFALAREAYARWAARPKRRNIAKDEEVRKARLAAAEASAKKISPEVPPVVESEAEAQPEPKGEPKSLNNLIRQLPSDRREELFKQLQGAEMSAAEPGLPALVMPVGELILPNPRQPIAVVEALNHKHSVVGNYGGKCAVLSWERWSVKDTVMVPTFQTFGDFRNRYLNRYVEKETEDGTVRVSAGKYWLANPRRLTYDGVVFEPAGPAVLRGNRLNLWRGWAVEPREGDWSLTRNHIYKVLGAGDPRAGQYIEYWYAHMFQKPNEPAGAVLAFRGDEGAGKGIMAHAILEILGLHGLPISNADQFTGAFSGHLQHCIFIFLDEAFWAGNVAGEGRLKSLVTEPTITPFLVRNLLHIMVATNNDWVVPARHGARRYAVFDVSPEHVGDFEYFDALKAELDGGGREAMLYDLLRLDLGGWHPKQIYKTAALMEQKVHSLRGLDAWIESILQEGRLPAYGLPEPYSREYPNRCLSKDLEAGARKYDQYTNKTLVGLKLREVFKLNDKDHFNTQTDRGWKFPALSDCRKAWELRNGGDWPWEEATLAQWRVRGSLLDEPM